MCQFESQTLAVEYAGEELWLHPSRTLYWPAGKTLFAADVHVGKEHQFGRQGIAMPGGISEANLQRLFDLAAQVAAKKLLVLGDFMHSVPLHSESWLAELKRLLDIHSGISFHIVAGNHDKPIGRTVVDARVNWHTQAQISSPFVFQHEPGLDERGYVLCGHIHPAWRIGHSRRSSIRTPIFWFRERYCVLPAFGEFTGGVLVDADPESDRIFMAAPEQVIEVPVRHRY